MRFCRDHPAGLTLRSEITMAEIKRTRRNTLERRCLGKAFKRLFVRAPKGVFKMLEKVKRV
ncbi:hypothetical protein AFA_03525 [Alcaligenes faecalis]|nr:hypothetical protein AFA_03525 [Alcaligenes faecalis]